jgi:ABC-type Fe3+-hydroxamate transport system substrate-binding protein
VDIGYRIKFRKLEALICFNPSGYSIVTDWERILLYNPEVLVVAPCGFEVSRSGQEIEATKLEGWETLKQFKITLFF